MKNDGIARNSHLDLYTSLRSYKEKLRLGNLVLKTLKKDYDTIAFSGHSGTFLGPAFAVGQNKRMALVRKSNDTTHSPNRVETGGYNRIDRYIIIDDFYSSGVTVSRIIREIVKFDPEATFVGFLGIKGLTQKSFDDSIKYNNWLINKANWILKIEKAAKRRHGKKIKAA
jgi:adenine/guanine phosphoribosyltransferase-like PRPP-binding protein